jgi:hypothetical protein
MSHNTECRGHISLYPVSAAIWRTETEERVSYSVTFEKNCKDSSGKWQSTWCFTEEDLLLVAKAANLAHDEIQRQHRNDLHSRDGAEDHS